MGPFNSVLSCTFLARNRLTSLSLGCFLELSHSRELKLILVRRSESVADTPMTLNLCLGQTLIHESKDVTCSGQ